MMTKTLVATAVAGALPLAYVESFHRAVAYRKPTSPFMGDNAHADQITAVPRAPSGVFSKLLSTVRSPAKPRVGMQAITLRPLSDGDSLDELTAMLHRAFARLGQMGLNCTCVAQTVAVTRERIEKGTCYVAVCDRRLVGTFTLYGPAPASESTWYHRPAVASIHQLGVDPEFQDKGLGTDLPIFAEDWARQHGYQELALETPQPTKRLVAFYRGRGYRPVESVKFRGKHYRSVVLSKRVAQQDSSHAFIPPILNPAAKRGHPRFPGVGPSARSGNVERWLRLARTGVDLAVDAIARTPTMAQVGRITPG
jgi:GNAT superfamily N-acetyltransferase